MHKNLASPIYFCAAGENLGGSSSKPTNHQTLTPTSLQASGMVSQMAHVTLVNLGWFNGRVCHSIEIGQHLWNLAGALGYWERISIYTHEKSHLIATCEKTKKMASFHLDFYPPQVTPARNLCYQQPFRMARCRSHNGDEHGVLDEGCSPTTGRIPESWERSASELGSLNPWISWIPWFGRNAGKTGENRQLYLELFEKMTCRAGFFLRKEANPCGIKKKEKDKKSRWKERKHKQNPSIIPIGAHSHCPFTFSKVDFCKNHLTSTSSKCWNKI